MNKLEKEASVFFKKNQESASQDFKKKVSSIEMFSTSLNSEENQSLDRLFLSETQNLSDEESYQEDVLSVKLLTSQIKAIQKQHVLLLGEKIYNARKILSKSCFSSTTFSSWLDLVFRTKSSAYNALAYYELFISLPSTTLQKEFQSIPYKSAYILAARKGDLKTKVSVIGKVCGMSNASAIRVMDQLLPSSRSKDNQRFFESDLEKNRQLSDLLVELLRIVCSGVSLSPYNENLLQQLFEVYKQKS
nr:CT583 family protein [Turicimonas muris]